MKFKKLDNITELKKIAIEKIYGSSSMINEIDYTIFYNSRSSFIFNTITNEKTKLNLTNFSPYLFDIKNNSLFLFLQNSKMTKTEEFTLYEYSITDGTLKHSYPIPKEFWYRKNLTLDSMIFLTEKSIVINYLEFKNLNLYTRFIVFDLNSLSYEKIDFDDNIKVNFSEPTYFTLNHRIYFLYSRLDDNENDIEKGIYEYDGGSINKIKDLDIHYDYKIIIDPNKFYIAFIKNKEDIYDVKVINLNTDEVILKKIYNVKEDEGIETRNDDYLSYRFYFGFSHNKRNESLFYRKYEYGYDIYNLDKYVNYRVISSIVSVDNSQKIALSSLLANNKLIMGSLEEEPKWSKQFKRKICEFED